MSRPPALPTGAPIDRPPRFDARCRPIEFLPLVVALALFLALGAHQLGLPGLHYDEAKEAGLNAMQLVTGQPVTAFRDATVGLGPLRLPLMVQDYIGALNVILAIPFLAVGGVNTVALRWLPLLTAALTLVLVWRVARRLGGSVAGAAAALLLTVNPSFIFWSRQGIFVTNITALFFMASLLTGLRWWQDRRPRDLWLTAFLWGLGLYAKLLFVWAIGAMVVVALLAGAWKARRWKLEAGSWQRAARNWGIAFICFLVPLSPLILFNVRTGGTFISIFGNLGQSYYGVENSAYLANLATRLNQVVVLLRGDYFWYLGEVFANAWAPGLAAGVIALAALTWALTRRRGAELPAFLLPLALLALIVAQSAFTVSDLFITHYALLLPLIPLAGGLAASELVARRGGGAEGQMSRGADELRNQFPYPPIYQSTNCRLLVTSFQLLASALAMAAILAWAGSDLWTTLRYHRVLAISGGVASHSDALADLAAYLDREEVAAPVALDWGVDAPVRFLTAGRVNPVEVFGYDRLDAPDAGFAERLGKFIGNPAHVYVAHAAERTVFQGRVEALQALAAAHGLTLVEEAQFGERSGLALFMVYRIRPVR